MDKVTKAAFQQDVEAYIDRTRLKETFDRLYRSLLLSQPEDPIDFLINQLAKRRQPRFIFIITDDLELVREAAVHLPAAFNLKPIVRHTLFASLKAKKAMDEVYVDYSEEDYVNLIEKEVNELESHYKGMVFFNFPFSPREAKLLRKLGIVPEKMIVLQGEESNVLSGLLTSMRENYPKLTQNVTMEDRELKMIAKQMQM